MGDKAKRICLEGVVPVTPAGCVIGPEPRGKGRGTGPIGDFICFHEGYNTRHNLTDPSYCAPCQEIEYTCPDVEAEVKKMDVCPGGRDHYDTIKTRAQVFTDAIVVVHDLFTKNCQIKTPGFFFDTLEKWREARQEEKRLEDVRKLLEAYVAQGFQQKNEDGEVKVEKPIRIIAENTYLKSQVIFIDGHGDSLEAAKQNWLERAMTVIVIEKYQVLNP